MLTIFLMVELFGGAPPQPAIGRPDGGVSVRAQAKAGATSADGGICNEYLWPRTQDCALKVENATWLGDTSVGVSKTRASVACGAGVWVCV